MFLRLFSILAPLAALALAVSGCNDTLDPEGVSPPSELTGQVILQNQDNHYGVKINLRIDESEEVTIISDEDGRFTIPFELHAGTWEVEAEYPFFGRQTTSFEVKNGLPEADLEELVLPQMVTFQVSTDKTSYLMGETVHITLLVNNITDQDIVLRSATSPLLAIAVVRDGAIEWGSLLPGGGESPEEVTIAAGNVMTFQGEWPTRFTVLTPGPYACYAVLAASDTFPDYFGPGSDELNRTLLAKLVPAWIELQ